MRQVVYSLLLVSLIAACSNEASSSKEGGESTVGDPKELALEAAKVNKEVIQDMVNHLRSDEVDVDSIDKLYDASKEKLLNYGKASSKMSKKAYEVYSQTYQIEAYEGNDSLMHIISTYRDSIIQAEPGNIIAMELQSYLSLGVFGDHLMVKRVFPSEYEELFAK